MFSGSIWNRDIVYLAETSLDEVAIDLYDNIWTYNNFSDRDNWQLNPTFLIILISVKVILTSAMITHGIAAPIPKAEIFIWHLPIQY